MRTFNRSFIVLVSALVLFLFPYAQAADSKISDEIARIIYSDLSRGEMLNRLAVYIAVGENIQSFSGRTGLDLGICFVGGPGVEHCQISNGLQLVADPAGVVQVIRRSKKVVKGVEFSEMSISSNRLQWNGYARLYPE